MHEYSAEIVRWWNRRAVEALIDLGFDCGVRRILRVESNRSPGRWPAGAEAGARVLRTQAGGRPVVKLLPLAGARRHEYEVRILRVVDGDTIDVLADLGFGSFKRLRARVAGVDAPETKTRDRREKRHGLAAAARVEELFPPGSAALMRSRKLDMYRRPLARFSRRGVPDLSQLLLDERLAVPYHGGRRKDPAHRAAHEANWAWREGLFGDGG